jgi:hypothetical protein
VGLVFGLWKDNQMERDSLLEEVLELRRTPSTGMDGRSLDGTPEVMR